MFGNLWIMIALITAIVFGTWALVSVTKTATSHLRDHGSESSLTTSELAAVIRAAVEEAVRPLEEKIDRLERQQRLLIERREGPSDIEESKTQ